MNNFEYFAPRSLKEVFSLLDKFGQKAKVLAGGTDLIAQMKMGRASPTNIIDIKNIQELNCLELSAERDTPHRGYGTYQQGYRIPTGDAEIRYSASGLFAYRVNPYQKQRHRGW